MEYLSSHCSIFVPNGRIINKFIQITGTPLTSLDMSKPLYGLSAPPCVLAPLQSGCSSVGMHLFLSSRFPMPPSISPLVVTSSLMLFVVLSHTMRVPERKTLDSQPVPPPLLQQWQIKQWGDCFYKQ